MPGYEKGGKYRFASEQIAAARSNAAGADLKAL
jgi:hypothetical protein